jgi:hypothetical protein
LQYQSVGKPVTDPYHPNFHELKLRKATRLGYQLIKALRPFSKLDEYMVRMCEEMPTKEDISEKASNEFVLMVPHLAEVIKMACEKLDKEPAPVFGAGFLFGGDNESNNEE